MKPQTRDVAILASLATVLFVAVFVAWKGLGDVVRLLQILVGAAVFWAVFFVTYRFLRA